MASSALYDSMQPWQWCMVSILSPRYHMDNLQTHSCVSHVPSLGSLGVNSKGPPCWNSLLSIQELGFECSLLLCSHCIFLWKTDTQLRRSTHCLLLLGILFYYFNFRSPVNDLLLNFTLFPSSRQEFQAFCHTHIKPMLIFIERCLRQDHIVPSCSSPMGLCTLMLGGSSTLTWHMADQ